MTQWRCPSCGNEVKVGAEDLVTVCEYCRTCFTVEGRIIKEHYLIPMYHNSSRAVENLLLWVKKQIGAEEDLPLHFEISRITLDFYPFWHANVVGHTKFEGIGEDADYSWPVEFNTYRSIIRTSKIESGEIERSFSLTYPASKDIPIQILDYEFPVRGRKYFSEAYVREYGGRIHNGNLLQQDVEGRAKHDTLKYLTEHLRKEVFEIKSRSDEIHVSSVFYLHAPIYHVNYSFNKKGYEAFIDASTGRILYATYPISIAYRAISGSIGAAHLLGAVLGGMFISSLSLLAAASLSTGLFAAGVVFLIRAAQFGRGREAAK